uniref:Epstein-Barr virus-like protein n=1 Tax=Oryza sativa subsp. japonica TaxID=39947 RepID=Q6K397_ORYSJ|nr:Epstein-Barr virus-like protein [Oryza sativa Japonica Group]
MGSGGGERAPATESGSAGGSGGRLTGRRQRPKAMASAESGGACGTEGRREERSSSPMSTVAGAKDGGGGDDRDAEGRTGGGDTLGEDGEASGEEITTTAALNTGRRWGGRRDSPACEERGAPVGFRQREAAAGKALAAAAWHGGGPRSDSTRPEMGGGDGARRARRDGGRGRGSGRLMGEMRERARGRIFMGALGAETAEDGPYLAGDVGSGERERGGFECESRPFLGVRESGKRWRRWAAMWARARGAEWGRGGGKHGGAGGYCRGTVGWRKGTTPTGGAHLSAFRREGEGETGRPNKGRLHSVPVRTFLDDDNPTARRQ